MGNSAPKIDLNKECIIWLDQNVFNLENKETYDFYKNRLLTFNFFCFESVKRLFSFIKDNKGYFEFRLFYIVVSGSLAEEFFSEYVKVSEECNILISSIVYCLHPIYHEMKPYFEDKFLNSGGVTTDFENVVNYILKDECNWKNINLTYKKYIPGKPNFGDVFMFMDTRNEYELALPILIGKSINSSLIEKGEIKKFQEVLLSRYCKSYEKRDVQLIKPSGNKNMNIPLHILTKFFVKFYSANSIDDRNNFYKHLNLDLSNGKFDEYHPFIFLIYDSLNKGYLKSYNKELYRGGRLRKSELKKIISQQKNRTNINQKLFYYSKSFLSFSKEKDEATKPAFFNNDYQGDTETVLFIIKKCKNEKYFISNVDIEKFSNYKDEKEVLILPLTCFKVVRIGNKETYRNVTYRKIYLSYLDKYLDKITEKINNLNSKNDKEEINKFFTDSIRSNFGKKFIKYYDKKQQKLLVNYCMALGASPDNTYFLSIIASSFLNKLKIGANLEDQIGAHLDDEIPNFIEEYKGSNQNIDKIANFFDKHLEKANIELLDNSYSIGFCIGSFLACWESYKKSPTSSKAFSWASLALGCGLPLIKSIPTIKFLVGKEIMNSGLNFSLISNGLNILWSVGVATYSIFKFHYEHNKRWKLTCLYSGKLLLKTGITIGFSILGALAAKSLVFGIGIMVGTTLCPGVTILIGLLVGCLYGYLGNKCANEISDRIFGKDEFVLSSPNLYYRYIPDRYRIRGNNPRLNWNKTYLCATVKSYIIECIINDANTAMRVINIPNTVYELDECLGYEVKEENKDNKDNKDNNEFFSEDSTDIDEENNIICKQIRQGKMYAGDLIIPYKGIDENTHKIDFIIFGINKEQITNEEWEEYRDRNYNEKIIEIGFVLSVY